MILIAYNAGGGVLMKKHLIAVMYFLLFVVLSGGCAKQESIASETDMDIVWSTSNHSDVTGLDYEESAAGFKAAFLTFEDKDFIIDEVQNWASTKIDADTYYTYINSDPDSWSAYIYHANEDVNVNYDSMKFYVENSTVKLYITSSDTTAEERSSYFLILVQAPLRAVWPNEVDVYIDDVQLKNEILGAFN